MHRLYYHEAEEGVYFAAEAKAILAIKPTLRAVDPQGFGELVSCGCVLNNRSLFAGIQLLPQGAAWTFRAGLIEKKKTYFDAQQWEQQETSAPEHYYQELLAILAQNLPRYFHGAERIGMSLTGGLDTRMIMAWQKASAGSLPCYSFGGMFRDSRDVAVAREVARVCGQPHSVIRLGSDFLSRFSDYAERAIYLTDGCVGVNHAVDLYLNKLAAEIAPVRMTGNYGGEVLRGVRAFKWVPPAAGLFTEEMLPYFAMAENTYAEITRAHPLSFAVFRQAPWHHYGLLALEQTEVLLRTPFLDNDLVRTVFRAPREALANQSISLRLIEDGDSALAHIPTDLGLSMQPDFLSESRRRVLEFLFKAEYAFDVGMPQWLARVDHLLWPLHLDRFFLGRHKFAHFRIWYRDVLSKYVQEILLDSRSLSRPYIERTMLKRIVLQHVKGERNFTRAIHNLLSLELINRLLADPTTRLEPIPQQLPAVLGQKAS